MTAKRTVTEEITTQPAPDNPEIELLKAQLAKLKEENAVLVKKAEEPAYDFWLESDDMSRNITDPNSKVEVWGVTLPEAMLDAIWYSMAPSMKGRLFSALEVARYRQKPPEEGNRG